MPELPEVETIACGLNSRVAGDVIESVWLGSKPEPLKSSAREIAAALESKRIAGVRRVGKHIVFDLEKEGPRAYRERIKNRTGEDARAYIKGAVDCPFGNDWAHAGVSA